MTKEKTAMQQFIDKIDEFETNVCLNVVQIKAMAIQMKPLEKEQLMDAAKNAPGHHHVESPVPFIKVSAIPKTPEEWFNEKYEDHE